MPPESEAATVAVAVAEASDGGIAGPGLAHGIIDIKQMSGHRQLEIGRIDAGQITAQRSAALVAGESSS